MNQETKFIFFSGKGGVGKTSMACASAVHYADSGLKTLIVTTDPASNLSDVFEQEIGHKETPIGGVSNLWAMEIDPDRATEEYRERIVGPMRSVMPDSVIRVIEEQFNSPCTTEIAAFDRFVDFMDEPQYEIVIFDTAPTGHTIRLLELPVDWSKHIEESARGGGQTCMGPVEAIQGSKAKYDRATRLLRDRGRTSFVFVVQPEETPIVEAERSSGELADIGIPLSEIIVNGILPPDQCANPFFARRKEMQERYLALIENKFAGIQRRRMYLQHSEISGIDWLRRIGSLLYKGDLPGHLARCGADVSASMATSDSDPTVERSVPLDVLLPSGQTRLLFFAGKGGVGKTVSACAAAAFLADSGNRVLLISTDPASHLGEVFEQEIDSEIVPIRAIDGLHAARIDQRQAAEEYKERIILEAQAKYSDDMLAAMREELESPCTQEMAAFEKFVQYATRDDYDVIVFDTAPTGHTLRLLQLPMDWDRQLEVMVAAKPGSDAHSASKQRYDQIIAALSDPTKTSFVFVVYPENTPIVEAHRASLDLKEAGIPTAMVIVNQVLQPQDCTTSFFAQRLRLQLRYIDKIRTLFDVPMVITPLLDHEIRGTELVRRIGQLTLKAG